MSCKSTLSPDDRSPTSTPGFSTRYARPGAGPPGRRTAQRTSAELLASCLRALAERAGFDPVEVDDVIAGNGILIGDHGDDIARLAVLLAGWPETVPGMTLNRFCGSGQQAVTVAASAIAAGSEDLVVAGGVESMSRWDVTAGVPTIDGNNAGSPGAVPDGAAGHFGRPHRHARGFHPRGRRRLRGAKPEPGRRCHRGGPIRPHRWSSGSRPTAHSRRDEHPRPGTSTETLARLRPAFAAMGARVPTVSNARSTRSASSAIPASTTSTTCTMPATPPGWSTVRRPWCSPPPTGSHANGVTPRAQIRAAAAIGSEPIIMLTAPGPGGAALSERKPA